MGKTLSVITFLGRLSVSVPVDILAMPPWFVMTSMNVVALVSVGRTLSVSTLMALIHASVLKGLKEILFLDVTVSICVRRPPVDNPCSFCHRWYIFRRQSLQFLSTMVYLSPKIFQVSVINICDAISSGHCRQSLQFLTSLIPSRQSLQLLSSINNNLTCFFFSIIIFMLTTLAVPILLFDNDRFVYSYHSFYLLVNFGVPIFSPWLNVLCTYFCSNIDCTFK